MNVSLNLVPYNADLDPDSHNFLPWLWEKLKADDLISIYFHDRPDVNFPTLVKLFSGGATVTLVLTGDKEDTKLIGFGALWGIGDKAASAGFAFFREFWDTHTTTEAMKALLTYWFNQFELDHVFGGVAEGNRAANIMLSRAGCKRQGKLPQLQHWKGMPSDAVVWAAYRADFPGEVN
jgi:RimJ/RimL family protein N-acetyltransferase